jgi:hypothetical protein
MTVVPDPSRLLGSSRTAPDPVARRRRRTPQPAHVEPNGDGPLTDGTRQPSPPTRYHLRLR